MRTRTAAAVPLVFVLVLYFLVSAASAFSTVMCISGFGVVRWCLALSFPSAHGIRRLGVHCCARGVFCLLLLVAADSRERRCAVCMTFKITWSGNKRTILCQSKHERMPPHPKHTHIKKRLFIYGNSLYGPANWTHTKGDTSDMAIVQPTESTHAPPRRDRGGQNTCLDIPLAGVCRSAWSRVQ